MKPHGAMDRKHTELVCHALRLGATNATVIETGDIVVRDDLAALCTGSGCQNFGLSALCPPHVAGPERMRVLVSSSSHALVVKLDAPTSELMSENPANVMGRLQRLVASIEFRAMGLGFERSRAFAGGSCKRIFCHDEPGCPPLDGMGTCRFGDQARPSLSGYGVDVARLMECAGWSFEKVTSQTDSHDQPTSSVVGVVILR